ncbi:hypothetical protein NITUZ_140365 [Candidatus Nitrosotenuis uzonensis]|uniref:Uncharacterized protein n=1 Tax=Candidatus Nitrosotenuis uzonensis TaxID=1407055 RepID=V6ARX7_9ARCH|nr:hypothetical protein NITUZ_140365 [Candidatus Nitrosotenuis uzonensis]
MQRLSLQNKNGDFVAQIGSTVGTVSTFVFVLIGIISIISTADRQIWD